MLFSVSTTLRDCQPLRGGGKEQKIQTFDIVLRARQVILKSSIAAVQNLACQWTGENFSIITSETTFSDSSFCASPNDDLHRAIVYGSEEPLSFETRRHETEREARSQHQPRFAANNRDENLEYSKCLGDHIPPETHFRLEDMQTCSFDRLARIFPGFGAAANMVQANLVRR
jgi:excinuclease UvrABC ATPase subunit